MRSGQRAASLALAGLLVALATGCGGTINRLKANYAAKQGNDFYKVGDYLRAIEWYRYATYLNPELTIAYYHAGLAYMGDYKPGSRHPKDVNDAEQAITNFKKVLEHNPQHQDARNYLYSIYLQAERYDQAAEYFQNELQQLTQSSAEPRAISEMMQRIGKIYATKGDFESALEWYKKRAEIDKDSPEAMYTIGVLCWDKVYKAGLTLDLDRRKALIEEGMDYLNRARDLKTDYYEAVLYVNLMYREKAKVAQTLGDDEGYRVNLEEANKYFKMANDIKKKAVTKG